MNTNFAKDKIIYVASPYAGDIEKNVRYAQDACRAVLLAGAHPYAPHLYITNILRDDVPAEREQGLKTGLAFLAVCDELWVFGPRISNGMAGEIEEAKRLGKPIQYVDLDLKIIERDNPSDASPMSQSEEKEGTSFLHPVLVKRAESLGWTIDQGVQDEADRYVEFRQHTPAGEDYSFTAWGNTDQEIVSAVSNVSFDFDAEEHAVELRNSNMSGVPDLKTLLEDAEEIRKMLKTLSAVLEEAIKETP